MKTFSLRGILALILIVMLGVAGCRKWPTEPAPGKPSVTGEFVGNGDLGGAGNILMAVVGPDSLGRYAGAIRYHSVITNFSSVFPNVTDDTLRFAYLRDNVNYSVWAYVGADGLALHFLSPSGVNPITVNRTVGGFNMSGKWAGYLDSDRMQDRRSAAMTMDQRTQLFTGTINVSFLQSAEFQVNSGTANAQTFHFAGLMTEAQTSSPFIFDGNYFAPDTITGQWQQGQNGVRDDGGDFQFIRTFN